MVAKTLSASAASATVSVTENQPINEQPRFKLAALTVELNNLFLDRKDLIDGILAAYISGTNFYVGGKPGTGKTQLGKAVANAFDARCFYYLLGADTIPSDMIGNLDMEELLNNNKYKRDINNGIADSEFVILDEGFKANSVTLNKFLGLILDKEIQDGKATIKAPLISAMVASNELPEDESLAAFWDRLSLRFWVDDVSPRQLRELLMRESGLKPWPKVTTKLSLSDLEQFRQESESLSISAEVIDAIMSIYKEAGDYGMKPSARKMIAIVNIIKAYAYVKGATTAVDESHLDVLRFMFWDKLEQRKDLDKIVKNVVEAAVQVVQQLEETVKTLLAKLQEQDPNDRNRYKAYLHANDGKMLEILKELDAIINGGNPGSSKVKAASDAKKRIAKLRDDHVLKPLVELEFN